jgi:hypothetical protein
LLPPLAAASPGAYWKNCKFWWSSWHTNDMAPWKALLKRNSVRLSRLRDIHMITWLEHLTTSANDSCRKHFTWFIVFRQQCQAFIWLSPHEKVQWVIPSTTKQFVNKRSEDKMDRAMIQYLCVSEQKECLEECYFKNLHMSHGKTQPVSACFVPIAPQWLLHPRPQLHNVCLQILMQLGL